MFYSKLKSKSIIDNKTFWETMNSILSDNSLQSPRITLAHKEMIISDNYELIKTFNTFLKMLYVM